jgi:hypothetical protein
MVHTSGTICVPIAAVWAVVRDARHRTIEAGPTTTRPGFPDVPKEEEVAAMVPEIYQAGIGNLTQRFGSVSNSFGRHWNIRGFQIPGRRGFHDSFWPVSA